MNLVLIILVHLFLSSALMLWLLDTKLRENSLLLIVSAIVSVLLISIGFYLSLIWLVSLPHLLWGLLCISVFMIAVRRPGYRIFTNYLKFKPGFYGIFFLLLLHIISGYFIYRSCRWGRTDARAIWSMHALFLTHEMDWQQMFTNRMSLSHPDYPLMLPSIIGIWWKVLGHTDALVPCVTAYFTLAAILLISAESVRGRFNYFAGLFSLLIFALGRNFAEMAAFQAADTLLALFMLLAFVLSRLDKDDIRLLWLTGLFAGSAAWVKNEGIAFYIIFSIALIWNLRQSHRASRFYLAGSILPVLIVVSFKICYAPPNDLLEGQKGNTLAKLLDPARYALIFQYLARNLLLYYKFLLIPLIILCIFSIKRILDWQIAVIAGMVVIYFAIFLISPKDLDWHLQTASGRLLLQLFPAATFVLTSLLFKPESKQRNI